MGLLALIVGFALATSRGRRMLMSFDPLFALLVIIVAGAALYRLADRADALVLAALAGRGFRREGATLALDCSAACFLRCPHRHISGAQLQPVRPQSGRSADHF